MKKLYSYILIGFLFSACDKLGREGHIHTQYDSSWKKSVIEVARPVTQAVLSTQKTVKPVLDTTANMLDFSGYIAFDERRNNKVAARMSGRIERLHVKYNYQYVRKGEPIAEIYSPELNTYRDEYLFLMRSSEDSLATEAQTKLKLLGLTESQIDYLKKSGDVSETITIYSPTDGFIRFSGADALSDQVDGGTSRPAMAGMAATPSAPRSQATRSDRLTEGVYISKGQTLFVVNDCRKVWAILSTRATDLADLKNSSPVTLYPEGTNETIAAKIELVEPLFKNKQRFVQSRVCLDNASARLRINALIRGEIWINAGALTVPLSAVYDLGSRKIVWVKTGLTSAGTGVFEPREVEVRWSSDDKMKIISGLNSDEEIALDAGYMLDSESILKVPK